MGLAKSPSINKIFVNENEHRLRSGWRIAIFMFVFMGFSSMILITMRKAMGVSPEPGILRDFFAISIAAFSASIIIPLARRYLDKKSLLSLGLITNSKAIKDVLFGFFLSGVMAGSVFLIMVFTGLIEVTGINWGSSNQFDSITSYLSMMSIGSLLVLLLMDIIISWWEELVFRGYLLQNMIEEKKLKIAVVISCIIYGIVHSFNPNATMLSTGIIVLFGFLRIYGYLATKLLWLSIGMHAGWNFFQGPIFGYAASGHKTATLIAHSPVGVDWLTGGKFGPEGSVLIIPIIGIAIYVMYLWANRKSGNLK